MTGMEAIKQAVVASLEKQGKLSQLKVQTAMATGGASPALTQLNASFSWPCHRPSYARKSS
jgi:hypothetical protein